MLAMSARDKPWSAFCRASSFARGARTLLSSSVNEIPSGNFRDNSPFGPFTETLALAVLPVTPLGTCPDNFPIRDILSGLLPDEGEQFAPGMGPACLGVRHEATRRAEDRHAESIADARDLGHADVAAKAGRRHAAHLADDRLAAGIPQDHAQHARGVDGAVFGLEHAVILDEVVLLQDPRDLDLEL